MASRVLRATLILIWHGAGTNAFCRHRMISITTLRPRRDSFVRRADFRSRPSTPRNPELSARHCLIFLGPSFGRILTRSAANWRNLFLNSQERTEKHPDICGPIQTCDQPRELDTIPEDAQIVPSGKLAELPNANVFCAAAILVPFPPLSHIMLTVWRS